jgi:hypothetical protein
MGQQTLEEYMTKSAPPRFQSVPRYFKDGDFVAYFLKNDMYYAQRIDERVTVYVSEETGFVVGCKIKSVSHLFKQLGDFYAAVLDRSNNVKLALLFLTAATWAEVSKKGQYADLAKKVGNASLDLSSLANAA